MPARAAAGVARGLLAPPQARCSPRRATTCAARSTTASARPRRLPVWGGREWRSRVSRHDGGRSGWQSWWVRSSCLRWRRRSMAPFLRLGTGTTPSEAAPPAVVTPSQAAAARRRCVAAWNSETSGRWRSAAVQAGIRRAHVTVIVMRTMRPGGASRRSHRRLHGRPSAADRRIALPARDRRLRHALRSHVPFQPRAPRP